MKLHLPKALFTAVIATFAVSQTVWGEWSPADTWVLQSTDTNISTADATPNSDEYIFLRAGEGATNITLETLTLADKANSNNTASHYYVAVQNSENNAYIFDKLTIKSLVVDEDRAGLDVGGSSKVQINGMTNTLWGIKVAAGASLTLGDGTTASTFTVGGSNSQSIETVGTFTVAAKSTLKFTSGSDAIAHSTKDCGIILDGSIWESNASRQSLGKDFTLTLKSGTVQDTTSTHGFGDGYSVLDAASTGVEIISSGASSISGGLRVRGADVTIEVTDGTLSLDTIVNSVNNSVATTGGIVKEGDGTLKITKMTANNKSENFYGGNTSLKAGTIEYAVDKKSDTSTLDGSYSGTISGTGNIAKSGTGTVTLASVNGWDGDLSVSGGTLNITDLSFSKTVDVTISGEGSTLNITNIAINKVTHQLTDKEGANNNPYYTTDGTEAGKNDLGNGFAALGGDYVLFNDYVWDGTVEGFTVSNDGTNTYLHLDPTVSTEYYISSGDVEVTSAIGASSYVVQGGTMKVTEGTINISDIVYTSGTIALEKDATINADEVGNLTSYLTHTTGTGTIKVAQDALIGAEDNGTTTSEFAGTIKVEGGTLYIGEKNEGNNMHKVQLSSATVELAGGNAELFGSTTSLGKISVTSSGNFNVFEAKIGQNVPADFNVGEVSVSKDQTLTIGTRSGKDSWHVRMNVDALTGEGNFVINTQMPDRRTYNIDTIGTSTTAFGNITNKETMNLGADGSSLLNMGDVTNTGILNIKGNLAGTSTISGGTITIEDSAGVSGDVTFGSDITLGGTLGNTGTVTLNGNVTVASLDSLESSGTVEYSENNGLDGYFSSAQYYVVQSTGDGAGGVLGGTDQKLNGTYTLETSGSNIVVNINEANPAGAYFVNTTVNYGGENGSTQIAADTTTGITMNGGTLNLNTELANTTAGFISTQKEGSVINIADGVTLDNSSVAAGNIESTLAGGATAMYDMGSISSNDAANVKFGADWKGTVVITNSEMNGSNLNNYGNANSTIKLVGYSGWLNKDILTSTLDANGNTITRSGNTIVSNLILEDYSADGVVKTKSAFVFDDNSQATYTFNGKVSGSGEFLIASKGDHDATIVFANSTADWTGGIKVENGADNDTKTFTVKFTGGGDIFSAERNNGFVMDRASTNENSTNIINLNIGHASNDSTMNGAISMGENADEKAVLNLAVVGNTTFKKDVEVTSLTVDANKTATLEGATTTGTLTTNGTVKVTGAGSLTYGGNTTVTAPAAVAYGTDTTGAEITSTAITGGVVTFTGDEGVTESRTISDSAIVNNATGTATITVGAQNASVNAAAGNIAMTTTDAAGTSVGDLTVAADKQVSSTGSLTVTDSLTVSSENSLLLMTGNLTLDGATVNLTGLTLAQDQTIYTLGYVGGTISANDVTVQLTTDQLTAAGFDAATTGTVESSADDALLLVLKLTAPDTPEPPTTLTTINVAGVDTDNSSATKLTLTTVENATDAVFGGALNAVMDDETWADIKAALKGAGITLDESIAITFVGADGATFDFDGANDDKTAPVVTINGEVTRDANLNAVNQTLTNNGTAVGNYVTAYIPEPTSTTLSLLALAALAVRRRRR